MNKQNKLILSLTTLLLIASFQAKATSILIAEAAGTVELYLASGTQVSTTYVSPLTSAAIGSYAPVRWGTFTGGFTPTADNAATWFANFVGVNGYIGLMNQGSNAGKISASITGGNSNSISSPVGGNAGILSSATLPSGSQLYAVIWNGGYGSNSGATTTVGGNTFYPTTTGLQAAILTNTSWIMPATSGTDLTSTTFTLSTGTTALIGALDLANKGVTMALIPEPSIGSLFAIGAAGLAFLRARRKS